MIKIQLKTVCGHIIFEYEKENNSISVACIGSRKGMTIYCFEDDIIWCGCWNGSLIEFENRVNDVHKDNSKYLKEYQGFIDYIKSLK